MASPEPANRGNSPLRLAPTTSLARENQISVGTLKEQWPQDVAAVICIGRRTLLRYRITNRTDDGTPCPGLFEIVRIRTDSRSDEYGLTTRQQLQEERDARRIQRDEMEASAKKNSIKNEENNNEETDNNNNNDSILSDNSHDYEESAEGAPQLLQTEIVAAVSSASLNPINPLPVFGSLHHFRVPLPSALSATDNFYENDDGDDNDEQENKKRGVEGEQDDEPAALSEVAAAGGIDGVNHTIMDLMSTMLKERKAFKKEPRDLTDTIKNPKFSTRDRIFAIALDGRSFAILSVAAPPLRPRKAQPIRVQFMGDGSLNKTAAAAAEEENRRRRELEERLRQERERKEREMNQDPPLFLRRTGSFPFEVTAAAMFILSYTDMVGLSDAYKKVGSEAAPVVGPLPFPPDASMSRCMKELSRMSTMCLRQKHCCFCYSAASGNFVILEMSSLSSDDVSVAGQAVVASGNIGPGWTSVVWAGPLCRSSDFVRSGTHRPYATYRVRFFCYNAESGFSTMETITIPCETLAPKGTSRNNNNNTAAGSGPNGSLVSESSASALFQQQQQKLRSRRRSTVTKLAPVESEGEIRTSSLIASPFSISGQRMCIMIAVANDSAILPLDDFDEQRATMMSCSSASSTSRLTASMTTPWTRFYSVASRISHEAWQKIESSLEDSQRTATPAFQGGNSSTTANNSIRNDKSFNASYSSEGSVLRPPSPAALRKRRPTAVVAQAIMQEKVFSIPELEWSRFVTIHERYTDGGNYDEVLSYSASRGTAWISRIVYDDRWHKKALEDRLNADLLADEAEDSHIRDEVEKLLATSTKIKDSNNTMIRRKSSTKNGLDGEDGGYGGGNASAFSPNSNNANDRKKSGKIARIRENNNGESDAAKRKSSQTILSDSGPEIDHRENDEGDVANDSNRGSRSRRRRRGGSNSNNNSQRRTSGKNQTSTMTPAERRAKGLQAVPPPGKSLRNRNNRNSASIEEYDENQDRRQESPNSRRNADSSGRDYKKMPSWGRAPFSNNNNSARSNSNNNNSSRRFDNDNNTGQDDDEEREGSQVHRPGTSAHHGKNSNNRTSSPHNNNNNNNYSDRPPSGKWVKPRPPSSSFAPLLFPKNGQPDQYGNYYANNNINNNRPGTGNSQFGRRPWSGSGHVHANNHNSQLPSLADDDAPEDYHYPGDIGSFGSRPPSSSRRAAVRSAAKAMAERVANNQESTPQELSKQRRSEAIVQSMSEMQKLGIGEEEGAEITDIEKIIKYMKKNDPKAQKANKQKKKEGEEVKKEGDKNENEDDDDDDDDDEEQEAEGNDGDGDDDAEAKKKKAVAPSISALRKSRSSVDRRIYKRAQELLAGSEITPEWFDAALLHLNRASGAADDARRTNIVFALSEEPMPTMQFQVGEREGKFIRRAKHSTSWSYVLNTRGDLPPKTSRQLRAERKHLQKAKDNEGNAVVDEAYVERFFKNIHPRETYVKAEFAKIEKERAKAMLGKNKETGEPLHWTEETLERLAVNHVKQLADRRAKAEKELDKEAAALQKTKTIPAQTYAEMMTRLGEDERKKNMLAKLQRENDKELSKLFLPAIHHPARNGNEGEKEIFSENPGVLSPEKVKEMANRLSTDFMAKKKEHVAALEHSLEEDRYRFIDEKTKAMYEAQKRPLSAEAEKELGERLAIPVIRSPAPR